VKVLVVGNGAREDALSWRLASSPSCSAVFAAPGNAGTAARGENWPIAATDGKSLVARARDASIDLVVLGPETAIASGVGDRFREAGIRTFGPNRSAGRLESSKIFAKRFLERHRIPTARGRVVRSLANAERVLADWSGGCVVKADGLAAGKGVVVARDAAHGLAVLREWYGSGGVPGGGSDVLLEDQLEGRELSVFALGDGRTFEPFGAACDYKRAGDGDTGPNTGGMGAYSPPFGFPDGFLETVRERILDPVARGLAAEGERYLGVLYCGLMWTAEGPAVIEFNVRFGDPETQVLMPRVRGDFAQLLANAADGRLDPGVAWLGEESCAGVVLATPDYPRAATPLRDLPGNLELSGDCVAFWAGSTRRGEVVDSPGGRVVTVTALGPSLSAARERVYAAVGELAGRFGPGVLSYRSDIAKLAEVPT